MTIRNCRIVDIHDHTLARLDAEGRYAVRTNMVDCSSTVTRIDYRGEITVLYVHHSGESEANDIHAELAFDVAWELARDMNPSLGADIVN